MGPRALLAVLCLASLISWGECHRVLVLNLPDAVSHQFVFFKVRFIVWQRHWGTEQARAERGVCLHLSLHVSLQSYSRTRVRVQAVRRTPVSQIHEELAARGNAVLVRRMLSRSLAICLHSCLLVHDLLVQLEACIGTCCC